MLELGPFHFEYENKLRLNEYAWNKYANFIFVEQPCGVGYSYSKDKSNYNTSDADAATDNYNVIQQFLMKFPHLENNDFYITSESWGGHYMPTLAKEILKNNKILKLEHDSNSTNHSTLKILNFKGMAVGNPYTDWYSGTTSMFFTWWGRSLISQPDWDTFMIDCDDRTGSEDKCNLIVERMYDRSEFRTNVYALDWPVCDGWSGYETRSTATSSEMPVMKRDVAIPSNLRASAYSQREHLVKQVLPKRAIRKLISSSSSSFSRSPRRLDGMLEDGFADFKPCSSSWMLTWMNRADVRTALHISSQAGEDVPDEDGDNKRWLECTNQINYNQSAYFQSTSPLYKDIAQDEANIKVLVFSGTDDSVCSTLGTQSWMWNLGLEVDVDCNWLPYKVAGQVAGYLTHWNDTNLYLATVLNAGHEVPMYRPREALHLFKAFLDGNLEGMLDNQ